MQVEYLIITNSALLEWLLSIDQARSSRLRVRGSAVSSPLGLGTLKESVGLLLSDLPED